MTPGKTPELTDTQTIHALVENYMKPLNAETLLGNKPMADIDLITIAGPQFTLTPVGWCVVDDNYDGPGSPMGWGATKAEALADLGSQLRGEE